MELPADLYYTASHEWIATENDGILRVGITDHAQAALGDIVFIELPHVGQHLKAGDACAIIESVKAASDIYAPVDGEVIANNAATADAPETVNQNAYAAWLFKIRPDDAGAVAQLLDADAYASLAQAN